MMLNRLLVQAQPSSQSGFRYLAIASVRSSTHVAVRDESGVSLKPEEMDKPGFFQRVALRWKGIPLKGEEHAPKATIFQDMDKLFYPANPPPSVPKDYKEFPERDLVNFPYPERHLFPPKTRLMIIPDSWLTPLEKITGTSGPYLFIGGLTAFCLNKEYLPFDEHIMKLEIFLLMYFVITRTFGYKMDNFFYNQFTEKVNELKKVVDAELKDAVDFRKASAAESESLKAIQEKFPIIFKENLALQLEATYRRNVDNIANELKRRIDYLQEVEATKLRFERDILLKSIIQGVQTQIDNNEGNIKDAYLDNCINQLKTLPA